MADEEVFTDELKAKWDAANVERGRALLPAMKNVIMLDLLASWLRVPDMRFGQLISNALHGGRDLTVIEDGPLARVIREYAEAYGKSPNATVIPKPQEPDGEGSEL